MFSGVVDNYGDPENVRYCSLSGLLDLYGASENVRQTQAAYLNDLIDIGVAGFRVDAAKHMWPEVCIERGQVADVHSTNIYFMEMLNSLSLVFEL